MAGARLRDAVGTLHVPAGGDARIVSLVPSITELLCDLGLAANVVGRTGFCIHPGDVVREIPKVGGTKDVKLERIRKLAPTHVIVNVDENRRDTVEELATFIPHIVVTHPLGPLDNLALYRLLGGMFGCEDSAESLCTEFKRELVRIRALDLPRRNVLYLIWRDPWMTVSRETYISAMLALVNWDTIPVEAAERYPAVELPSAATHTDLVLLSSEPYRFREKHVAEVEELAPGRPVTLIDGGMTSWYGSRAIRGLHYLGEYAARYART